MQRMTTVMWAGENARFSQQAADGMIGQQVPVDVREHDGGPVVGQMGMGRVIGAELVEQGRGVELTVVIEP